MNKLNKNSFIVIHHSGGTDANKFEDTSSHTVETIDTWHKHLNFNKSKLGFYVGYHFVIEKSGKTTQTRRLDEKGCHCIGVNDKSVGICLTGNFDRPLTWDNSYPTKEQIKSLKILLQELVRDYNIPLNNIVPHRRFANKTCPGKNLQSTWARNLLIKDPAEALKKQISILQKIIEIYIKLLALLKKRS